MDVDPKDGGKYDIELVNLRDWRTGSPECELNDNEDRLKCQSSGGSEVTFELDE